MSFITEKHTEAWLTPETRYLRMPDGTEQLHTNAQYVWRSFDELVAFGYDPDWIVEIAVMDSVAEARPFDLNFESIVAYIRSVHRARWGDGPRGN